VAREILGEFITTAIAEIGDLPAQLAAIVRRA